MQQPSRIPSMLAAALLSLVVAGCGGDKDKDDGKAPSASPATGEPAPAKQPSSGADDVTLPDGFPEDVPLPADLTISSAKFVEGSATTQANYQVIGTSSQSVSELAAFYLERLPQAGYELRGPPPPADAQHAVIPFRGNRFSDSSVQITKVDATTRIILSLPLDD